MVILTIQQAIDELTVYSKEIQKIVENEKMQNNPQSKILRNRKFLQFEYNGHRIDSVRPIDTSLQNWDYLIYPVIWRCRDSQRIRDVDIAIKNAIPSYPGGSLLSYVSKLVHLLFIGKTQGIYSINNLAKAFVKKILKKPLKYKFTLELVGILLNSPKVKISSKLTLSKIKKSDLERKIPLEYYENFEDATENSTAKFEIEYEDSFEYASEFDKSELHLIPLRLFKLGNIQHTSIRRDSEDPDSFTTFDEVGFFKRVFVGVSYLLKQNEVENLQKFWKEIIEKIPDNFLYSWKRNDSISIAYERYMEALGRRGSIEFMLAHVVMGLEALLLDGDDEINYRLKMRTARILQILGLQGKTVFDDLAWAYKARSAYAHGTKLSRKDINKIRSVYEKEDILILRVLNYLRVLLVAFLLIDESKNEVIRHIDDSWLLDSSLKKLKKSLAKSAKLLELKKHKPKFTFYPMNRQISDMVI